MINAMVLDLVANTRANTASAGIETLDDVHRAPALAAYSADMSPKLHELKIFLRDNLYRHEQVLHTIDKARRIVADLFEVYMADTGQLPPRHQARAAVDKPRAIADYIAGMTDRYAEKEHRRLCGGGEF
jgi:dGTPase